jgi:hypothetical protein
MKQTAAKPMSADKRVLILDALGQSLAIKRKDAIDGRANSGIETDWRQVEEFYEGYDDANRAEFVKTTTSKPTEGGRTAVDPKKPGGSTAFPNITQPYVDAASARIGDMLLPTDDRNYAVEPTPIPDLDGLELPDLPPTAAAPAMPGQPPGAPPAGMPGMPPLPGMLPPGAALTPQAQALETLKAKIAQVKEVATRKAKAAETQIDDWLTECQYTTEYRRIIDDACKIGSGVFKGPVPVTRKTKAWRKSEETGEFELFIKEEIKPASFRVDPWNFFPDPACGDSIHDGGFTWERDYLTAKRLQDLKRGVGAARYIDSQIDAVIAEGPSKRNESDPRRPQTTHKDVFEVWYFHGTVTGEQMEAAGCQCDKPDELYPVKITMVNDRVIKAAMNPLDSGEYPYDVLVIKPRAGSPWGMGIARQGRTPQRIVVAASRNLMDNAGASSKPHKVMTDDIEQDGDPWTWRISSEAGVSDARMAMTFFQQPSIQGELMNIINWGMELMEKVTGMPMILMGLQGDIEETAAGRTIQNNNGNSVLRRIARLFDAVTERHLRRYYAWLMEYGENEEAKGDFQIVARGSSALVERDAQSQILPQILQMSLNPAYELSPKKTAAEMLKSQRFDPATFQLTDEEKKEMAAKQQPPVLPQVEAAKVNAQARITVEDKKQAGETEREKMRNASEEKIREGEQAIDRMVAEIEAQLGAAGLTQEERLAVNDVKATLSGLVMKLNAQDKSKQQLVTPPTEPPGRAAPGHAYAQ